MRSYISPSSVFEATEVARLLSDPTRVRILVALKTATDDMCVNEIAEAVGSSHSATSHQLSKLEALNVVECFRDGQKMCYELKDNARVTQIITMLTTLNVL